MSTYTCPECSCGFPEEHGRVNIDNRYLEDTNSRLEWLVVALILYFQSYYEIHCPNCENVIIGGEDDD